MRSILCGLMAIMLISSTVAQNTNALPEFPRKPLRLAAAVQGYCTYPGRLGVSVDGKVMIRGNRNKEVYNEFVITGKAAHTPSINGGSFFSAFDGKKYNNLSAVMVMAGYRMNFGLPRHLNPAIDAIGGAFIELNAGGSYLHHIENFYPETNVKSKRTWAPAFSGVAGYSISRRLDILTSYTGSWPFHKKDKTILSFVGAGLQYNF